MHIVLRTSIILPIIIFLHISGSQGQLLYNEDRPPLIDQILQVVWEPSSLIRWWVGADQLFNIVRSWRTVAENVVTLPFREGRSMSHVKIQQPRRAEARIKVPHMKSDLSHWERFNLVYSESNAIPKVPYPLHKLTPQTLPPPFLFQPQEIFWEYPTKDKFQQMVSVKSVPFANRDDAQDAQRALLNPYFLKYQNHKNTEKPSTIGDEKYINENNSAYPMNDIALYSNPQMRLFAFLRLLKNLGEMHVNTISSDKPSNSGVNEMGL